jgi:hypothetical protein
MFKVFLLAMASCLCVTAGTIVYTDFGPSQAYNNSAGWNVGLDDSIAAGFDPSSSGTLLQVDLAIENLGAIDPLSIMLETNSAGAPSGTVLDSWTAPTGSISGPPQVYTFTSTLNPTLTAGTEYWLVLSSADPNDFFAWMENSTETQGLDHNPGGGWNVEASSVTPVFDVVTGSAAVSAPEPATLRFTGVGCLALLVLRRKRGTV